MCVSQYFLNFFLVIYQPINLNAKGRKRTTTPPLPSPPVCHSPSLKLPISILVIPLLPPIKINWG